MNLIGIHWESGAQHINYRVAVERVAIVGEYVANLIKFLDQNKFPLGDVTLVGHSLGAQCAGVG